jgi:acyl transferase domain-containing protein/acyl carrier protein
MSDLRDRITQMSPARLALLALELDERLQAMEGAQREPIAIVGLGCRLPGAPSPDAFWQLLREGVDAVREVPADRWDVAALFDPDPDAPGKVSTRWGGFLEDIRRFDAAFFNISPREAVAMDPQQRLALEVSWEALEHAGMSADAVHGSQTGVFMGVCAADYGTLLDQRGSEAIDAYLASGNAFSVLSGRISYLLGLHGPSLSIDTACSSSLVAMHLACQSLRSGECRMALAGGVNMMVTPRTTIALSRSHMMAPDGRCKSFDAAADGFVRGEGCGIVVLKRLSDAEADNDRILAVIRGSASNQDGRSSGLTAPNGPAQEAVIRAALAAAGLAADAVDYVEAHGTGTSLGDPIEVRALAATLGAGRAAARPLLIGSAKTNIGHLESAAGVAGLLKLVLSLQHGEIPGQLHFHKPNPHIAWDDYAVRVVTAAQPWQRGARPRIAAVSSFGFSGTNAHLIVEEAPAAAEAVADVRPQQLLTLSATSEPALLELARRWSAALATDVSFADACHTAAVGRAHLPHRLALVAASGPAAASLLAAVADGSTPPGVQRAQAPAETPRIAFLYTGQGSQYAGMGRELFAAQPVFREAIERCARLMDASLEVPLTTLLFDAEQAGRLDQTAFTQPAIFAIEYALTQLWRSWGVQPTAALGHSLGEIAAACAAGALSLEDAVALVLARSRLMQALPAGGAMAVVFASPERVGAAIAPHAARLSIAAINGPEHTVVSGDATALAEVRRQFEAQGVSSQALAVSHAFHSPLMAPMVEELRACASTLQPAAPRIEFISNVTGAPLDGSTRLDAAYWTRHVLAPVQFERSVQSLYDRGYRVFVEIGPHPVLLGMSRHVMADDASLALLASLHRNHAEHTQLYTSLGRLHLLGAAIDWPGVHRGQQRRRIALPTYPFQRQVYWPSDIPATRDRMHEPWRQWLHELLWEASPLQTASAQFLRTPASVAAELATHASQAHATHRAEVYDTFYPALDAACAAYICSGLRELGCPLRAGDTIEVAALARKLGVVDRHRRLFARLFQILAEDGWLEAFGGGYRVVRAPADMEPAQLIARLRENFPGNRAEIDFTAMGAPALAGVLRGRLDPVQILFPDGSATAAEALYEQAPGLRMFNTLVAEAVLQLVADAPPGRPLRILEIGAGTGSTTSFLLPRLTMPVAEYVFTDISAAFLARAREKFAAYPFVSYGTLDIERDMAAQGYAPDSFDIVIGANVVHATADLAQSVRNIHTLLAPGGTLLLLETTRRPRFGDLTVGYTDGWWRFTDTARRPDYALLTRAQWLALFAEQGFDADGIGGIDGGSAILASQALLLARRTLQAAPSNVVFAICVDDLPQGERLLEQARRTAEACLIVRGSGFTAGSDGGYVVDPLDAGQLSRLVSALRLRFAGRQLCLVGAWGATPFADDADVESVTAAVQRAYLSALHLAQACAADGGVTRLALLTQGAQPVRGMQPLALAQSTLWGLGRSIRLEHPELHCTLLDLPADAGAKEFAECFQTLSDPALAEVELAWQGGTRFVRRVDASPARNSGASPVPLAADGTYLVTGGLAGLGLLVAVRLADEGARTLVLAGRREPQADALAQIEALRARGVAVTIVSADIGTAEGVARAMQAVADTRRSLRGVVHAAGATDDASLLAQTWQKFERVMGAKVRGAWLLHRATARMPLDFFVMFASGAAFLGSPGQANHAAANAFMDALAHHRRAAGLPALSIDWGAWSEVGAATRGGVIDRVGARGLRPIPPADGLAVLLHLMAAGTIHCAVLPMDWRESLGNAAPPPLLSRIIGAAPVVASTPAARAASTEDRGPALAALAKMPPQRIRTTLRDWVHAVGGEVLQLDPLEVDPARPLSELGMDSLMAVEFRNKLAWRLARALPATLVFNYPTLNDVIAYLEGLVTAAEPAVDQDARDDTMADLDNLSEDELATMLAGRLGDG